MTLKMESMNIVGIKGSGQPSFFLRKGIMKMTIKDILTVTGGRTKVVILSTDEKEKYIALWYGNVDDIDFEHVPFGNMLVSYYGIHIYNKCRTPYP